MERVYLDCTGLPHSIPVRSEIPNTIYIDASNLQTVLDNFLQVLPNVISEGLKANPLEQRVMQKIAEEIKKMEIINITTFENPDEDDKLELEFDKGYNEAIKNILLKIANSNFSV
jgi:hypothetical protein